MAPRIDSNYTHGPDSITLTDGQWVQFTGNCTFTKS